jgi:hypothetical protein
MLVTKNFVNVVEDNDLKSRCIKLRKALINWNPYFKTNKVTRLFGHFVCL